MCRSGRDPARIGPPQVPVRPEGMGAKWRPWPDRQSFRTALVASRAARRGPAARTMTRSTNLRTSPREAARGRRPHPPSGAPGHGHAHRRAQTRPRPPGPRCARHGHRRHDLRPRLHQAGFPIPADDRHTNRPPPALRLAAWGRGSANRRFGVLPMSRDLCLQCLATAIIRRARRCVTSGHRKRLSRDIGNRGYP